VPNISWGDSSSNESAAAILISNNAYRLRHALGSGTRPRLDQGELGVTVLAPIALGQDGAKSQKLTMRQWTTVAFTVAGAASVPAGIDGEAATLEPPLRFNIRPRALRVRIAPHHPGASPSALEPDRTWQTIESLAALVVHGAPAAGVEATRSPNSGDDHPVLPANP
jgi:hypothetical protein